MAGLPHLEALFPNLLPDKYEKTSEPDPRYNCIAWAADDNLRWWEPVGMAPYYWPPNVPLEYTLASYIEAFEQLGYEKCDDGKYTPGIEKIAIYVDRHGAPSHAARQRGPLKWTSKLGEMEDIDHATLDELVGNRYGNVAQFLRRRLGHSSTLYRLLTVVLRVIQKCTNRLFGR
ncbi:MAG: hypothetical protein QOJ45_345 [Verrucomicrobiota bacterium]|jgi:hypothetical protein